MEASENIANYGRIEPASEVVQRIARLTRMLRESMRELGLDHAIQGAVDSIPDARDRLRYVGRMTEQAANRVLNAAEHIQPLQDELSLDATYLQERWAQHSASQFDTEQAELVADTRQFLQDIPTKTQQTQDNLMEIIMAQDFQDLTGQVIQGMLGVIGALESELVQLLVENVPKEKREETDSLLNGPVVDSTKENVVAGQDEVDDLLSSLGF